MLTSFTSPALPFTYLRLFMCFVLFLFLANTASAAKTRSATKKAKQVVEVQSEEPDNWDWFEPWFDKMEDYAPMKARAVENGIDMLDVGYLSEDAPDYYRLKSMHGLMVGFRTHLFEWLQQYGFRVLHKEGGYKKPVFPEGENIDQAFRKYIHSRDPLLMPSMAHMFHLIVANRDKLSQKEQAYFDLCQEWADSVVLAGGLTYIDWEEEYQKFIGKYNANTGWIETALEFPRSLVESELLAIAEKRLKKNSLKLVNDYLFINEYPSWPEDGLNLRTVWHAVTLLYNDQMQLDSLDHSELFSKDYVLFVLKLALTSSYLRKSERDLTVYWLKLSEIRNGLHSGRNVTKWRKSVEGYTPLGYTTFNRQETVSPQKTAPSEREKNAEIHGKPLQGKKDDKADDVRRLAKLKPRVARTPMNREKSSPKVGARSTLLESQSSKKAVEGDYKVEWEKPLVTLLSKSRIPAVSLTPEKPIRPKQKTSHTQSQSQSKPTVKNSLLDSILASMGPIKETVEEEGGKETLVKVKGYNHPVTYSSLSAPARIITAPTKTRVHPKLQMNRVAFFSPAQLHQQRAALPNKQEDAVKPVSQDIEVDPMFKTTISHFGMGGVYSDRKH